MPERLRAPRDYSTGNNPAARGVLIPRPRDTVRAGERQASWRDWETAVRGRRSRGSHARHQPRGGYPSTLLMLFDPPIGEWSRGPATSTRNQSTRLATD